MPSIVGPFTPIDADPDDTDDPDDPDDPDEPDGPDEPVSDIDECPTDDDAAGPIHDRAVDCFGEWGITDDLPEAYIPADPVTRGQLATYLARLATALGITPSAGSDAFADDDGNPHEAAINQLAALGILLGDGGLVSPGQPVTRGQMATVLVRLWAVLTGEALPAGPDAFDDDDRHTHEAAINALAAAGITTGTDDGYDPDTPLRGDQMATFLTRLVERLPTSD